MMGTNEIVGHTTREAAKAYSSLVLSHAREHGNLEATKSRMARWVNVLVAYEKDSAEVMASDASDEEKAALLAAMHTARHAIFEELFQGATLR